MTQQAYKVEELLAMRDSVSESAVSIEKFPNEDAIKEHVLRSSASVSYFGARTENNPYLSTAGKPAAIGNSSAGKKPSPSPSVKRGKAEALLKEHGSPPGLRVTAGGRIVPSDLPPLGGPRYPYGSLKGQSSTRLSPALTCHNQVNPDYFKHPLDTPFGNVIIYDAIGQACVYINDRLIPLHAFDSVNQAFHTANLWYLSAMTPSNPSRNQGGDTTHLTVPAFVPGVRNSSATNLAMGTQSDSLLELPRLKKEMATKQAEHKYLEQTQVLERDNHPEEWNKDLVIKKKTLVTEIDQLRRQIKSLEAKPKPSTSNPRHRVYQQSGHSSASQLNQMGASQNTMRDSTAMLYPESPDKLPLYPGQGNARVPAISSDSANQVMLQKEPSGQSPNIPNSANRRSHAVEIKAPTSASKQMDIRGSNLDPTSPTYEPKGTIQVINGVVHAPFIPPTPSPIPSPTPHEAVSAQHPWLFENTACPRKSGDQSTDTQLTIRHKISASSVSTADFFPTNTHEHSSTRMAPQQSMENMKAATPQKLTPSTPQKAWPNSSWNSGAGSGTGSAGHKSQSMLSTQVSPLNHRLSSFSQDLMPQLSNPGSRSASYVGTPGASARASRAMGSGRQSAASANWSPFKTKAPKHVMTTYQEGYQAGLRHKFLPENNAVVHGYHDGLQELLERQAGKETTGDSTSEPNDSAVALSFQSQNSARPNFSQENLIMAPSSATFSPNKDIWADQPQPLNMRTVEFCTQVLEMQKAAEDAQTISGKSAAFVNNVLELQKQHRRESEAERRQGLSTITNIQDPLAQSIVHHSLSLGFGMSSLDQAGTHPQQRVRSEHRHPNPAAPRAIGAGRGKDQRVSGFDGAMDDLAEMIEPVTITSANEDSADASCFRSSKSGKQKTSSSPAKATKQSPAKAGLENALNRVRSHKQSKEEKAKWREDWRIRFRQIKSKEAQDIEKYNAANPLPN